MTITYCCTFYNHFLGKNIQKAWMVFNITREYNFFKRCPAQILGHFIPDSNTSIYNIKRNIWTMSNSSCMLYDGKFIHWWYLPSRESIPRGSPSSAEWSDSCTCTFQCRPSRMLQILIKCACERGKSCNFKYWIMNFYTVYSQLQCSGRFL